MALDLWNIQGNIVPGFYKDRQEFLFVRFPNAKTGRDWLKKVKDRISSAHDINASRSVIA